MKKSLPVITAATLVFGATALILKKLLEQPLDTVGYVDLNRYLGRWYEIARIPQWFERGCTYSTAFYSLNEDGSVAVKNSCIADGNSKIATGKAQVTNPGRNSKLDVQFFWPLKGKYWIIDLAPDYSYAMVGHPNRNYLWILSRKPWMDKETYKSLLLKAMNNGFDIARLKITKQKAND